VALTAQVRHNPGVTLDLVPAPDALAAAGTNVWDRLVHGGLADLRPMPSSVVVEGPQRTVRRFHPAGHARPEGRPALLVPPLAAPAVCFNAGATQRELDRAA
jgi:polyhydroxyalkanoate synthase